MHNVLKYKNSYHYHGECFQFSYSAFDLLSRKKLRKTLKLNKRLKIVEQNLFQYFKLISLERAIQ